MFLVGWLIEWACCVIVSLNGWACIERLLLGGGKKWWCFDRVVVLVTS